MLSTYVMSDEFYRKRMTKKAKNRDLGFCFEFQVVVAVVGFLWHS